MCSMKPYTGRVPACACFCGGCPNYIRDKKPCPGAQINFQRCLKCKSFHLCCQDRGITHCFECPVFPCRRYKDFAKRWLKYGQDFIENQYLLKQVGTKGFLKHFNDMANKNKPK